MGRSFARHPLINYVKQSHCPITPPVALPMTNDKRSLPGIKIVEFTRIIAGTAAGEALASMGAEVIRVNSSKLKDYAPTQIISLMAGKAAVDLDLNDPADHMRLTELLEQADVILQGYQLGSLSRRGFGLQEALEIANRGCKGIIYVDENCYGPEGVYLERSGMAANR